MTVLPPPDESLRPALEALAARDRDLARAYAACGLPPVRRHETGFAGLLTIMTAQQVSAQSARAIAGRLKAEPGALTPDGFLALDEAATRRIGLSRPKVRYGRALAEAVLSGALDLAAVAGLTRVTGLGRWSAEIYLLFSLGRPDVWPAGDLAVCVAAQRLKRLDERPAGAAMVALGEPWRPHRSAAARFLWHFYRHPGLPD